MMSLPSIGGGPGPLQQKQTTSIGETGGIKMKS